MLHRNTKIIAITSALIFVVSVAAFVGFSFFVWHKKQAYVEMFAAQSQYGERESAYRLFEDTYAKLEDDRTFLDSRIIDDAQIIDLLALVEAVGREQGVTLTTSSLSTTPLKDIFETLVVRMEIKGSYESVLYTLMLLEQLPYQVLIPNVQMTANENGTWTSNTEVHITKRKKI